MEDEVHIRLRYRGTGSLKGKARPHRPQKPCQYNGCDGWAWARGYCDRHYQKLKREGQIQATRIVGDPVARFRASYHVNDDTGCWEWIAWMHPKGYGVMPMGGKSKKIRAHRFSWELHKGPLPADVLVLHTCDNRRCCNPKHLFLGDNTDNMRDCVAKGRHGSQTGTIRPKITPTMALNIRVMFARGQHSMQNLADIYEVDRQTISTIVNGRSHQEV